MDKFSHMPDFELVACYSAGCDEAFDTLLYRHKDALYNYISYNIKGNACTIDDVFQETFVKVIMNIRKGRYKASGSFESWLKKIAHNIIIDNYRLDSQLPLVSCDDDNRNLLNEQHVEDSDPEAQIANEQTLDEVKLLMEKLPATQREVMILRYYENRSFKEISEITGACLNTCLCRMRYGLINMRRMAEKYRLAFD